MAETFRYVGRRDNKQKVTGQRGFSSFAGQFDPTVYQEYFEPFPLTPIEDAPAEQRAVVVRLKLSERFAQLYKQLRPTIPVAARAQLLSLSAVINEAASLGDLEVISHIVTTATLPAGLEPYRRQLLEIVNGS